MGKGILWAVPSRPIDVRPCFEVKAHQHITLCFGAEKVDVLRFIGKTFRVADLGMYSDHQVQAIAVKLPEWVPFSGETPHITVSHAEGIAPYASVTMLKGQQQGFDTPCQPWLNDIDFVIEFKGWNDDEKK